MYGSQQSSISLFHISQDFSLIFSALKKSRKTFPGANRFRLILLPLFTDVKRRKSRRSPRRRALVKACCGICKLLICSQAGTMQLRYPAQMLLEWPSGPFTDIRPSFAATPASSAFNGQRCGHFYEEAYQASNQQLR